MNSQASQLSRCGAWLAVMGAVLAGDDGSRKVTDADIDVACQKSLRNARIAIGRKALNLSDGPRIAMWNAGLSYLTLRFGGCGFCNTDAVTKVAR
jgi:hypothetical protein